MIEVTGLKTAREIGVRALNADPVTVLSEP